MNWTDVFKNALTEIENEIEPELGVVLDGATRIAIASSVAAAHVLAEKLGATVAPIKS
jgi:hypothetical protein